jgi:hypothetical protein
MTYQNDPGRNPPRYQDRRQPSMTPWIVGALAIFAVLGVIIYSMTSPDTHTVSTKPVTTGLAPVTTPTPAAPAPATGVPARP